jgi:type IV pilus assembly protein PilB
MKKRAKLFKDILVENKIISEEQLNKLLERQKDTGIPLSKLLVEVERKSEEEVQTILREYQSEILIGDLLIQMGLIGEDMLKLALAQKTEKEKLGDVLIREELINESTFLDVLSGQLGIPRMVPKQELIDLNLVKRFNREYLKSNHILPAFKFEEIVTCIMADPLDEELLNMVESTTGCKTEPAIASKIEITKLLDGIADSENTTAGNAPPEQSEQAGFTVDDNKILSKEESTVVAILNDILKDAFTDRASDIHIESRPTLLVVRNRIDGILYHKFDLPKHIAAMMMSRIKVLGKMDITQKRMPQDGRSNLNIGKKQIDMRIGTYPGEYGENITIRLLDKDMVLVDVEQLGFNPAHKKIYNEVLDYPTGLIVVTGPTGSGKTTTLYSSLNYLKHKNKKIITVEDPVEYTIPGIIQAHYKPAIGVTYDVFLKAMLRQDPDVLMVGEMRDRTATEATIQTALTGHKVFSTFHTADAAQALYRMMDMGIETFLIFSTVKCVIAQRLVRRNCPKCLEPYTPPPEAFSRFRISGVDLRKHKFVRGKGCSECRNTGYKSRIGIFEILLMNDEIRQALIERKSSAEIKSLAHNKLGVISIMEDGFYKALKGITTLDEVIKSVYTKEEDSFNVRTVDEIVQLCEGKESNLTLDNVIDAAPTSDDVALDGEKREIKPVSFRDMGLNIKFK